MNTTHQAATFKVKEIDNNYKISFNLSHIGVSLIYFYIRVFNHMNTTRQAATFRVKES